MENIGAWFNKKNWKDMRLILDKEEQPPEGFVKAVPLPGVEYQYFDEESGAWAADPNSEALEKIAACKKELAEIDVESGAGRAVRALALGAAKAAGIESNDFERLQEYENRAALLREKIAEYAKEGI